MTPTMIKTESTPHGAMTPTETLHPHGSMTSMLSTPHGMTAPPPMAPMFTLHRAMASPITLCRAISTPHRHLYPNRESAFQPGKVDQGEALVKFSLETPTPGEGADLNNQSTASGGVSLPETTSPNVHGSRSNDSNRLRNDDETSGNASSEDVASSFHEKTPPSQVPVSSFKNFSQKRATSPAEGKSAAGASTQLGLAPNDTDGHAQVTSRSRGNYGGHTMQMLKFHEQKIRKGQLNCNSAAPWAPYIPYRATPSHGAQGSQAPTGYGHSPTPAPCFRTLGTLCNESLT